MKRAKIMLVAIAVLATVGGALAFKAQKFGEKKFCYLTTDTQPAVGACKKWVTERTERASVNGDPKIYYITTETTTQCTAAAVCDKIGVLDLN